MSDMIDRQAAIDTLEEGFKDVTKGVEKLSPTYGLIEAVTGIYKCLIGKLPSALPDNSLQKLADEIAKYKRTMRSSNSDYFTGYMSALSMVEGMIADMMPHEPYEGVRE